MEMQNVVEDDEEHALVGQEDQPFPTQPLQGGDYVRRGEGDHQDRHHHLVRNEPGGRGRS